MNYSGTPLIRPPTGQNKVVVLTGWSYYRGTCRVVFCIKHVLINVYFNHICASHGMEVPCIYKFTSPAKYTELLEKLLDFDNNLSVRKEIAGKKQRFEQDQPEVGDKKKKKR